MAGSDWVWRWELTPKEAFHNFKLLRLPEGAVVHGQVLPWDLPLLPLGGHPGLTYQFGVTQLTRTVTPLDKSMILLRKKQPGLAVTGDRRSGVIILDGTEVVSSYVYDGRDKYSNARIVTHTDYRGRGLALAAMVHWEKYTMRPRVLVQQQMNAAGLGVCLDAQVAVTNWAVAEGKTVPQLVLDALEPDSAALTAMAAQVESDGVVQYVDKDA